MISISFFLSPQGASRGAPAQERFRALCGEHHGRGRGRRSNTGSSRANLGILHGKWMNMASEAKNNKGKPAKKKVHLDDLDFKIRR